MTSRSYRTRIEALEQNAPAQARKVFRVIGGGEGDQPADFIRAQGHDVSDADLILHRVIVSPSESGPQRVAMPMRWANAA